MSTEQIQIGDIYNNMPIISNVGIGGEFFSQENGFIDEIKTKGPIPIHFSEPYLQAYVFTAEIESSGIVLRYADEESGLDFKIKLSMNEDGSGGTVSLVTIEPTIQAGVLSSRLWYLFISNKYSVILLKDGKVYNITVSEYPEEERKKLFYRAKIFRKLQFIESCLKDKLREKIRLPKTIVSNDIALIDTIFRGITRGNVYTVGDNFSTRKSPPFDTDPYKLISNIPRPYSFSINEMSLFNYSLPLGRVDIIFPYATAKLKEEPDGTIELTFRPLDEQVIFHFSEYSKTLPKQYDLLNFFKKELLEKEPQELVESTTEPLLGDVSSIEASEIAVGWLSAQIRNVPRPAMRVEKSELVELGKYWKVDIWLLGSKDLGEGSVAIFPLSFFIERFTGKVIKPISIEKKELSVEEIEKAIIDIHSAKTKAGLQPLVNPDDIFKE